MAARSANISPKQSQKLQSRREKGLGSRTIKLWAAVCYVNEEARLRAALSSGNVWEKTLIRIKCSCCTITHTHTHVHIEFPPLWRSIVWHTCKDANCGVHIKALGGMQEDGLSLCFSVWFTLLSLQFKTFGNVSETWGRLTGAAERPGQRKTSWSQSGSGSPEEICEKKEETDQLVSTFYSSCPKMYKSRMKLTVFSVYPKQRKDRSCLQWSRRFHSFGDPF